MTKRDELRAWLRAHDRTQIWLAWKAKVDESMLSKVLAGYRQPSPEFAEAIRRITQVDLRTRPTPRKPPTVELTEAP